MPKSHSPTWSRKPDGRPFINVIINGKRRRLSLLLPGETAPPPDAECQRRFERFLDSADAHPATPAPPKSRTISALCDWYVETIMPARGYRESTREQNRVAFRRWTTDLAARGVRTPNDLERRPDVLDEVTAERLRTQKSSTVWKDLSKLKAVFAAAVSRNLLDAPPLREWPQPKRPAPEYHDIPSQAEIAAFLERTDATPYGPIVRFIAYQGCRPVDACELTIDRVHGAQASIRQSKTGHPVPLEFSNQARDVVRAAIGPRKTGAVFLVDERPIDPNTLCAAIRRHGAHRITAKTLRQSVVSTLLDLGYDLETVRRITGHRSNAIWNYRKLRTDLLRDAAQAIATGLTTTPKPNKKGARSMGTPTAK